MSVSVRRDVVILACAASAGIHGALAPLTSVRAPGPEAASSRGRSCSERLRSP